MDVESTYSKSRWMLNWFIDASATVMWMLNFDLKSYVHSTSIKKSSFDSFYIKCIIHNMNIFYPPNIKMHQHLLKCHLTPFTYLNKDINIMNKRYQDQELHIFQPKYCKDIPSNNLH